MILTLQDFSPFSPQQAFDEIWSLCLAERVPVPAHKKSALRHFVATVKTPEAYAACLAARENYKASDRVRRGFVQDAHTWFNDWQSWMVGRNTSTHERSQGERISMHAPFVRAVLMEAGDPDTSAVAREEFNIRLASTIDAPDPWARWKEVCAEYGVDPRG